MSIGGASTVRLATTYLDGRVCCPSHPAPSSIHTYLALPCLFLMPGPVVCNLTRRNPRGNVASPQMRLGRGGFGSLFVFEKMGQGEQAQLAQQAAPAMRAAGAVLAYFGLGVYYAASALLTVRCCFHRWRELLCHPSHQQGTHRQGFSIIRLIPLRPCPQTQRLAVRAAKNPAVGFPALLAAAALAASLLAPAASASLLASAAPPPVAWAAHLGAAACWGASLAVYGLLGETGPLRDLPRKLVAPVLIQAQTKALAVAAAAGAVAAAAFAATGAAAADPFQRLLLSAALACTFLDLTWCVRLQRFAPSLLPISSSLPPADLSLLKPQFVRTTSLATTSCTLCVVPAPQGPAAPRAAAVVSTETRERRWNRRGGAGRGAGQGEDDADAREAAGAGREVARGVRAAHGGGGRGARGAPAVLRGWEAGGQIKWRLMSRQRRGRAVAAAAAGPAQQLSSCLWLSDVGEEAWRVRGVRWWPPAGAYSYV